MKRNYYLLTEDIENHTILDMNCMELYIGKKKICKKSAVLYCQHIKTCQSTTHVNFCTRL